MFPVSNVERNALTLSGISIASSVRSAGFGGHDIESLVERMDSLSSRVTWRMPATIEGSLLIVWCSNSCATSLAS